MLRNLQSLRPMLVALGLLGFVAAPAFAGADFQPSRTSGVAPLLVHFDATSTTSASAGDPFHEVYFHWDFGDAAAGNWTHTSSPKNQAHGPIAAHVYEQAGTYTARLETTEPDGTVTSKSVTINVQDPDVVFSGTNTVCVSASGNFNGCPSGAARVTSNSFGTALSHASPGKRVLLRRGDSFGGRGTLQGNGPGILGAYGSTSLPAPVVTAAAGTSAVLDVGSLSVPLRDWRVMDLAFVGASVQYSGGVFSGGYLEQLLFLRMDLRHFGTGIIIEPNRINRAGLPNLYDEIGVVESVVEDMEGGSGGNGLYMGARRMVILGNTVRDTTRAEHLVRLPFVSKLVMSHNLLAEPAIYKTHLKLHAIQVDKLATYAERDSYEGVISENISIGGINGWSFNFGPQNGLVDERVRQMIVERNYFTTGTGTNVHNHVWARDVTVRNNRYDDTAIFLIVGQRGIEPPPQNVQAYDNCTLAETCSVFAGGGSAPSAPAPAPAPSPTPQPPAAPVLLP